jgi:hypothetical protein
VKPPVAPDSSCSRSRLRPLAYLVPLMSLVAGLSLLAGCPGQLEGAFPPPGSSSGTGGDSSGSGGSQSGSGGSGTGGGSGSGGSTVACDAPTMVFKTTCGGTGCHDQGITPALLSASVNTMLVGKPAVFTSNCASGTNLVNPALPLDGVLLRRIKGGDCGTQMPSGKPALTSAQIQCVTDWLTSILP